MSWSSWLLSWFGFVEFAGPEIDFTFHRNGDPRMPIAGTLTISLSTPDPAVTVAKRMVVIAVGTGAPDTIDAIGGPVTVPCNEDDGYTGTVQDISKGGVASSLTSFSGVATDTTTAPAAPTVTVTFAVTPPSPPVAS